MTGTKFPANINHRVLELYRKDPLAFEARYIYGLKPKEPYKKFVRALDDSMDVSSYDEETFFHYQRARVQERLRKMNPAYLSITTPFMGYKLTERVDHVYDDTVVLFTFYTPPSAKSIGEGESLRLPLATVCAEHYFNKKFENFEYWHLKGYKEIIVKTRFSRETVDEALYQIQGWLPQIE